MTIAEKILRSNLPIRARTQGSSMLPFIRMGDRVVIRPARVEQIKIGDIIAYSNNGQNNVTCHRLVKKVGLQLVAKGDTHIRGYERISHHSLLGKVVLIERSRYTINLETNFYRLLAFKIAWFSLNFPVLLVVLRYLIEALRAPHLVPMKAIRKINTML